jgi:hypothetical protein
LLHAWGAVCFFKLVDMHVPLESFFDRILVVKTGSNLPAVGSLHRGAAAVSGLLLKRDDDEGNRLQRHCGVL